MTTEDNLLYVARGIDFLAVTSDDEEAADEVPDQQFIIHPIKRRQSSVVRRRSSVRSRLSVHAPQDSEVIPLSIDYSSDLSRRTIQDFQNLQILGVGSYGRVYLVKDKHTGKLFARKTIKKAKISVDKKLFKTQKNERDILSNISHPNIVKLFYTFHDEDNIDFILEYIPGGEIFYHLATRTRFNETDTAFYLAEVSLAIYHLHQLGVVYRDLKPENVMLSATGHVVLTDFGLSSVEETCHSILGTPQFTAPEVIKGDEYSYPADWWSLGIMMYDMLLGGAPFDGRNKKEIFNRILTMKIRLPTYLSLDAKDLLSKLLNRNPLKRMKVDEDFKKFQQHRFFRKIDWKNLQNTTPPISPNIDDLESAENFDHNYIKEALGKLDKISKGDHDEIYEFDNEIFKGFSFTASSSILENHFNDNTD
jgi:serine/threonine protein kinase